MKDGVHGGSRGAILRRFDNSRPDNSAFDEDIFKSMTKTRWLQIKRVYKLCNNLMSKKRGEQGFDPAYKYRFIYDVLAFNVNALTKNASLDICGDESLWPYSGFGDTKSGLTGVVMGKPGISKGGQIVVAIDRGRFHPRAFLHRHKLHNCL